MNATAKIVSINRHRGELVTVRMSSICGPCLTLGTLVDETPKTYAYIDPSDRHLRVRRVAKETHGARSRRGHVHTAPCARCTDHPRSCYREGYMD